MGISLIIVITLLFALIEAQIFKAGYRFEDHSMRFILRALVCVGMAGSITDFFLLSSIFYAIFDYALNYFRGLPILTVGKTSIIDKFFKDMPYVQLALKVTLVITAFAFDL